MQKIKKKSTFYLILGLLLLSLFIYPQCAEISYYSDAVLLWDGFYIKWLSDPPLSHRISLLKLIPSNSVEQNNKIVMTQANQQFIGGTFTTGQTATDVPYIRQNYTLASSEQIQASYGHSRIFYIDQSNPEQCALISFSLSENELSGFEEYAIFLSGFSINTDIEQPASYPEEYDPAIGYTLTGFGMSINNVEHQEEELNFSMECYLKWGWDYDRVDMGEAIPHARTEVVVYYNVYGYNGAPVVNKQKSYSLSYDNTLFQEQAHATMDEQQTFIEAPTNGYGGAVGITGFRFESHPNFPSNPEGYYIYAMGVENRDYQYDPQTNIMEFLTDGYLSNTGIVINPLSYTFTGGYQLMPIADNVGLTSHTLEYPYEDIEEHQEPIQLRID